MVEIEISPEPDETDRAAILAALEAEEAERRAAERLTDAQLARTAQEP